MANSITIPGEFKAFLKQLHSMGLLSFNLLVLFTQNRNDTFSTLLWILGWIRYQILESIKGCASISEIENINVHRWWKTSHEYFYLNCYSFWEMSKKNKFWTWSPKHDVWKQWTFYCDSDDWLSFHKFVISCICWLTYSVDTGV